MRRFTCSLVVVCCLFASQVQAQTQTQAWPHPIPCRIQDGNNPDLFMMVLGDVNTPLAQGLYDPAKDRVALKDGTAKEHYYRDVLGVRYYQPFDKTHFPLPPSGWCTWYYYYSRITAVEVKRNTQWISENLKDYGAKYVQIDDGWQLAPRDWTGINKERFPDGMADVAAYVKSVGLTPGLWLAPHGQSNAEFVNAHPTVFLHKADGSFDANTARWEGRFLLDPSTPESLNYMSDLFSTLTKWGYEYFKIDGQPLVVDEYNRKKSAMKNPSDDPNGLYRKTVERIRQTIGPDRYLLGCWGIPMEGVGIMNGSRTRDDIVLGWGGFRVALDATLSYYYQHNIVWYTDPDVMVLRSPLTAEQARAWATLQGLTGQALMGTDRLMDLGEERVDMLRRVYPAVDIRPLDLFPAKRDKRVWDLKINHLGRAYDVIGVFNFGEKTTEQMLLKWSDLGLPADIPMHVFDFWNKDYLGAWEAGMTVDVAPTSCRVLTVVPSNGQIQLISTNRHITQGWVDLAELKYDDTAKTYSGKSHVIKNDPHELRFAFPRDHNFAVKSVTAKSGDGDLPVTIANHQGWATVKIQSGRTADVTWQVQFEPSDIYHYPTGQPENLKVEPVGQDGANVTWNEQYWLNVGCRVYLDGKLLGYTPKAAFPLRGLDPRVDHTVGVETVWEDGTVSPRKAQRTFSLKSPSSGGEQSSAADPATQPGRPASVPYTWKSVQMVGAGFVDGIVFHPTAKGVRYCRTDMGGAYRWNDQTQRWEPLLDWVSYEDVNLMGVESIAVDPADPNRVYLACGTYTNTANTAILRSDDRGRTFQRANVPFRMGGNEDGRGNGERMAVDPHEGRILYFGSRQAGLWKSTDRAATWSRVTSFPDVNEAPAARGAGRGMDRGGFSRSAGIVFVLFDPRSGSAGKPCTTIYAGVSLMGRDNLFRSTDGGATWQSVPGEPTQYRPNHAVWASDGTMYVSYGTSPGPSRMNDGGVWKLNTADSQWTDITPDKPDPNNGKAFGYASVAVDARNPRVVIASSFGRPRNAGGEDIFRSTDGGKTWKPVFGGGGTYDHSLAPYVRHTGIHWLFDIEIDPADSNHAMFTTGYGGHETFNLTDMDSGKPAKWSVMSTGIEESVALDLLSPPQGAHLISAIGDYGGFVHWDLDKPAPEGNFDNPHFGNTNSVACAENQPETIVRVGRASGNRGGGDIGYSLDRGKTWQPAAKPQSGSTLGYIAVSSDGSTWIWTPQRSAAYFTRDRGATWTECRGVPANTRIIADRVNPKVFYGLALFEGKLYVSTDAGATFAEQALTLPDGLPQRGGNRGDGRGGQDRLYATHSKEGDLWLAAFNGLYHSTDSGKTFTRLGKVTEIHAFGFGKEAPGAAYPALYLIGVVDGVRGIFRSDDTAKTWVRINDDQHQWGLLLHITGDPKQYGRVYVGTHGRGTVYGDPAASQK